MNKARRALKQFLLSLMVGTLVASFSRAADSMVTLKGHVPKVLRTATKLGRLDASEPIPLGLVIHLDQNQLDQTFHQLYGPNAPKNKSFLSSAEFAQKFGLADKREKLKQFARTNGLTIDPKEDREDSMVVKVSGSAGQVEKTFGIQLNRYRDNTGRLFRSPDTDPLIPVSLMDHLSAVTGLSNLTGVRRPNFRVSRSSPASKTSTNAVKAAVFVGTGPNHGLSPADIKTIYKLNPTTLDGTGQTVAVLEGDVGYNPADIAAYAKQFNLPNPSLQYVGVDGIGNICADNLCNPNNYSLIVESDLDIELVTALAPRVSEIMVYNCPDTDQGFLDATDQAATDDIAKVVSQSYGEGEEIVSSSILQAEYQIFERMTIQGQSNFACSMDWGAGAYDPASQPYVTGTGGTTLSGTLSAPVETAWPYSGGGVSTVWLLPDYQVGVKGMASLQYRNIPDVALNADNDNSPYAIYIGGSWYGIGGTSAASPLWAALTALVNQQRLSAGNGYIGFLNPSLYQLAAGSAYSSLFNDITSGNNIEYYTGPGYDNVTGWGSYKGSALINAASQKMPDEIISAPTDGQALSNLVTISGTANAPNFASYKVEYAVSAPSPVYHLIGTVHTSPVTNNTLESWNTTALPEGIYWLKLTITDTNNKTYVINVANLYVDRSIPTITITSPQNDSNYISSPVGVTITASAKDDVGIKWVQFVPDQNISSQITSTLPPYSATFYLPPGKHTVTATAMGFGGVTSTESVYFYVVPVPELMSLSPFSVPVGSGNTLLTLTGANFVNDLTMLWNGKSLVTTFVSPTELTAVVPAADLTALGTAGIYLSDPHGWTSSQLTFDVTPSNTTGFLASWTLGTLRSGFSGGLGMDVVIGPSPIEVWSLGRMNTPNSKTPYFLKLVQVSTGQDVPGGSATVYPAGPAGQFTYANLNGPISLTANTTYYLMSYANDGAIDEYYDEDTLVTPFPVGTVGRPVYSAYGNGGWMLTGTANHAYGPFDMLVTTVPPALTGLSPTSIPAGSGNTTLTIHGTEFANGASVTWNGSPLVTTFVSATQLTAVIPASLITKPGPVQIGVRDPDGWTSSNTLTLDIMALHYVKSWTLGTQRNNWNGWVGMEVQVGTAPLSVSALGRIYVSGNSQSHTVKLVQASNGQDVPGGSVTFTPTGTSGQFSYGTLPTPVTLNANTLYYLVSHEVIGGDQWYNNDTILAPSTDGSIPTSVYSNDSAPQSWLSNGAANHGYAPVDFQYATLPPPHFVSSKTLGTIRNNWDGWVGMEVQVGMAPLSVSSLGRIYVSGNSKSHTVKLVQASNGQDVPGGSVTFTPTGTSGQFSYATLTTPVTLNANTLYYLVSHEVIGGDQWYNYDTILIPSTAGSIPTSVYSNDSAPQSWLSNGAANHGYAPVDFQYTTLPPLNFVASKTLGTIRNNWNGWVGMNVQVGALPLSVSALGRIYVSGNSKSHTVKLVQASNGQDVPGGSVTFTPTGTNGQFSYATLTTPVKLSANTLYYLVSHEISGSDQWYNNDTVLTPSTAGSIPTSVYSDDSAPRSWLFNGPANHGFAPVDFQYSIGLIGSSAVAMQSPILGVPSPVTPTATLQASYPYPGYVITHYQWMLAPWAASGQSLTSGSVLTQNVQASSLDTSGNLALGSLHLAPGPMKVEVVAYDDQGNVSPAASAQINIMTAPGNDVQVFPSPWRAPRDEGHQVTFTGMPVGSTVKLFTVSGRFVKTLDGSSGTATWDVTNDSGQNVASGLYLYLVTDPQGNQTRGKLGVIR